MRACIRARVFEPFLPLWAVFRNNLAAEEHGHDMTSTLNRKTLKMSKKVVKCALPFKKNKSKKQRDQLRHFITPTSLLALAPQVTNKNKVHSIAI